MSPSTLICSVAAGTAKQSPRRTGVPSMAPEPSSTIQTANCPAGSAPSSAQKNARASAGRPHHRLARLELQRR